MSNNVEVLSESLVVEQIYKLLRHMLIDYSAIINIAGKYDDEELKRIKPQYEKLKKLLGETTIIANGIIRDRREEGFIESLDRRNRIRIQRTLEGLSKVLLFAHGTYEINELEVKLQGAVEYWEINSIRFNKYLKSLMKKSREQGITKIYSKVSDKLEDLELERQTLQASKASVNYAEECSLAMQYHSRFAFYSLCAFFLAIIVTFRLVFWQSTGDGQLFFWWGPEALKLPDITDVWHFIAFALSKLILASFAVGICVITCRVYLAHQHNIVTLRHQKLAATALRDFFDTMPPEEKDARMHVVTQCVTAITTKEQSGFLKEDVRDYTAYTTAMQKLFEVGRK